MAQEWKRKKYWGWLITLSTKSLKSIIFLPTQCPYLTLVVVSVSLVFSFSKCIKPWLRMYESTCWYHSLFRFSFRLSITSMVAREHYRENVIHCRIEWVLWWNYCRNADFMCFLPIMVSTNLGRRLFLVVWVWMSGAESRNGGLL